MFCHKCGNVIPEAQLNKQAFYESPQNTHFTQTGQTNDVVVWILAFVPVIGVFFAFGTIVFLGINIALCYIDEYLIKKQGYDTSYMGNTWFVPTYLYKRAKTFGHNLGYFIVWCVTFGLSFIGFL